MNRPIDLVTRAELIPIRRIQPEPRGGMDIRRGFALAAVLFVALIAAPLAAHAQPAGKVWRIGYLAVTNPATKPENSRIWNAFIEGLHEHGYVEGQNVIIEYRYSEGRSQPMARTGERTRWAQS
jgi:hypothetical protein